MKAAADAAAAAAAAASAAASAAAATAAANATKAATAAAATAAANATKAANAANAAKPAPAAAAAPAPAPAQVQAPPKAVTLYQHCDYGGYKVRLTPGNYDLGDLVRLGVRNDDVSAISFEGGARAALFEHGGYGGKRWDLSFNVSCFVSYGFNDILSSIKVW
jgi:hypothetical protein